MTTRLAQGCCRSDAAELGQIAKRLEPLRVSGVLAAGANCLHAMFVRYDGERRVLRLGQEGRAVRHAIAGRADARRDSDVALRHVDGGCFLAGRHHTWLRQKPVRGFTYISTPCGGRLSGDQADVCARDREQGRCLTGIRRADSASVNGYLISSDPALRIDR